MTKQELEEFARLRGLNMRIPEIDGEVMALEIYEYGHYTTYHKPQIGWKNFFNLEEQYVNTTNEN
jgi:hypothetical protein